MGGDFQALQLIHALQNINLANSHQADAAKYIPSFKVPTALKQVKENRSMFEPLKTSR